MHLAECLAGDELAMIVFTARSDQVDLMKTGATGLNISHNTFQLILKHGAASRAVNVMQLGL